MDPADLHQFASSSILFEHAGSETLEVREFVVHESLSSLFSIQLVARSRSANVDFGEILGGPARFVLQRARSATAAAKRQWSGVVSHIEQLQPEEDGLSTYAVSVVPYLWFLTQRKNYRMFQQLSEPEIVLKLLADWGIEPELRLDLGDYKARRYRVQYGESDFTFMSRMLEDAGITYLFEDRGGSTQLVLTDKPHRADPREQPVAYVSSPNARIDHEFVTAVTQSQRVRPGKYTVRDVDFRRAPDFPLLATAAGGLPVEERLERFQYVPGAFLFRASNDDGTPVADDRGKVRSDLDEGQKQTQKRLDAKRGNAKVVTFVTSATDLAPGLVFAISGHPRAELARDKTLLVVSSTISGGATDAWMHTCDARFTTTPYRPALSTPKPRTHGMESATVVGPAGEEIHTDEFGRIRVHFHWDRESQRDERSSAWIPVSQSWGGGSFGGVNLPRIGQEVLVDFLAGDPDRPIVVGRVFTNTQKVPYALPKFKMVSTLRSETTPRKKDAGAAPVSPSPTSSPLGFGVPMTPDDINAVVMKSRRFKAKSPDNSAHKWIGNEITLDDTQGKEKLYLQAQKNMNIVAKNRQTTVVGNTRSAVVGTDDTLVVTNKQAIEVGKDRSVKVGASQTNVVHADIRQESVTANQIFSTHETFGSKAKRHVFRSDVSIVLQVHDSTIVMAKDFIVIQAKDVFINPGNEATAAAIEGYRPQTQQEREAEAKRRAAERAEMERRAAEEAKLEKGTALYKNAQKAESDYRRLTQMPRSERPADWDRQVHRAGAERAYAWRQYHGHMENSYRTPGERNAARAEVERRARS